jgi:hypothetical protein
MERDSLCTISEFFVPEIRVDFQRLHRGHSVERIGSESHETRRQNEIFKRCTGHECRGTDSRQSRVRVKPQITKRRAVSDETGTDGSHGLGHDQCS